eukprot:TRINITY_DN73171_c0_g1_i1.p1 TRINITY_DN73171_c0_g1~~TRINITY_DN73171_c0_g1_i1.p1  ORF type:complete len:842 (-),score=48.19 TRINITY_DN73171_c0_g1_i1:336-2777(-)
MTGESKDQVSCCRKSQFGGEVKKTNTFTLRQSTHRGAQGLSGLKRAKHVLKTLDKAFNFSSAKSQGHEGAVTCVATNVGMFYIVTGGEDCTTRVWTIEGEPYSCYCLTYLHHHTYPVSSVALTMDRPGQKPVVFSSSREEGLFIWDLETQIVSTYTMMNVVDVCCKREISSDGGWVLAVAFDNIAQIMEAEPGETAGTYDIREICTLVHEGNVLQVQHVPGDIEEGAAIGSCAAGKITLWRIDGTKLVELLDPSGKNITCFNISPRCEVYCWLVAGGDGEVSVWALRGGQILESDAWKPNMSNKAFPIVQYPIPEGVNDVAVDPGGDFLVVARQDHVSEMLSIVSRKGKEVGSRGPAAKLVQRMSERTVFTVKHQGHEHEMTVSEYVTGEGQLLVATAEDGLVIWELEGAKAGKKIAELRSVRITEMLVPFVLLFVTFIQVYSFAFGPAAQWEEELKRSTDIVFRIVLCDIVDLDINVPRSDLFWARSLLTVSLMAFFIVASLIGLPYRLTKWKNSIRRSRCFLREVALDDPGCGHFIEKVLGVAKIVMDLLFAACTTILAVPTFSACAHIFDCVRRPDGKKTLATAPNVVCYEDAHLTLCMVTLGCVFPYFYMLVPHAVVAGNCEFVQYSNIFRPWTWTERASAYATLVYKGYCHPYQQNFFRNSVADLIVKISLAGIAILTTSLPMFQMVALTMVGTVHFILSITWLPYVDGGHCALVQGLRLLTMCAMWCGVLTTIDQGKYKALASQLLFVSLVVILPCTLLYMMSKVYCCVQERRGPSTKYTTMGCKTFSEHTVISQDSEPRKVSTETE